MLVGGRRAPVVGRISMDLTTLDVGSVPGAAAGDVIACELRDGDRVDPLTAAAAAAFLANGGVVGHLYGVCVDRAADLVAPNDIRTGALSTVLQHLRVLEADGLVHSEKVGRVRTCRIEPAALKTVGDWVAGRRALWERSLDRPGDYLAATEDQPST